MVRRGGLARRVEGSRDGRLRRVPVIRLHLPGRWGRRRGRGGDRDDAGGRQARADGRERGTPEAADRDRREGGAGRRRARRRRRPPRQKGPKQERLLLGTLRR